MTAFTESESGSRFRNQMDFFTEPETSFPLLIDWFVRSFVRSLVGSFVGSLFGSLIID